MAATGTCNYGIIFFHCYYVLLQQQQQYFFVAVTPPSDIKPNNRTPMSSARKIIVQPQNYQVFKVL